MVFDPKHPRKGPTTVPNSYILTSSSPETFDDMVKEVDALAAREGRQNDVQWKNKMPIISVAMLNCDEAFAAKVKNLPSVGSINKEHIAHIQKKKHGGPSI